MRDKGRIWRPDLLKEERSMLPSWTRVTLGFNPEALSERLILMKLKEPRLMLSTLELLLSKELPWD